MAARTPWELCYHGVRGAGAKVLAKVARAHPERDELRSEDDAKLVIAVIVDVLAVLDGYEITDKPGDAALPPKDNP